MLKDKVCLVTGATKGIGLAIAHEFLNQGAIVYVNAKSEASLDGLTSDMGQENKERFIPLVFDVTDYEEAFKGIKKIKSDHGRLDVLVNNAGIVTYELLPLVKMNTLRELLEINVVGSIQMMQLALKLMARQKSGSIINISSLVATRGAAGQLAYSASKGAMISATKSAAKELSANGIRVNAIAPGMVATKRLEKVMSEKFKHQVDNIGFKRLAKPEEIAKACTYFASDDSTYVTGQILEIDGSTTL